MLVHDVISAFNFDLIVILVKYLLAFAYYLPGLGMVPITFSENDLFTFSDLSIHSVKTVYIFL